MPQTAIQLYTLRDLEEPLSEVLKDVAATPFDGVEFTHRVRDADVEAIATVLEGTGLTVASAHVGLENLEESLEETLAIYERLGCDTLVVPYLDETHFESAEAVQSTARRLSAMAETVADRGFELHYHNHDHEFVDCGDSTAMEVLLEESDDGLGFELDLGWAVAGGLDPVTLLERYGDRISLAHFADVETETMSPVELGDGDVDLEACLDAARRADVEWYIYEHDEPTDPRESLEHGAAALEEFR
ncbi:sugar phosphate isomerase/epimerase family protein [Natronorubrum texcoconense]|uniref:Sugar phosphate isomerase/epimerase n=1 Tax=Natronorubrum texcoconense TaxID=1095776 RepID=A0A1G9CR71_9EURY|nr:sugar phosphate isomerase/epimerase [Natronorubrum texcoconense]SDK53945.1 Sugar phosphate isomerase/epimerase [Natronorubrum texcoconense]